MKNEITIEQMRKLDNYMGWTNERIATSINAEQCLELMEKLKLHVRWVDGLCYVSHTRYFASAVFKGKTINEAVTNAAIAAIKEE